MAITKCILNHYNPYIDGVRKDADIPIYIENINSDYKLILRKYIPWWGAAEDEQEVVLSVIPTEKTV